MSNSPQGISGLRLTFLLASLLPSDNFDFTSQNQFSTSQNSQANLGLGRDTLPSSLALLSLTLGLIVGYVLVISTDSVLVSSVLSELFWMNGFLPVKFLKF